VLVVGAGNSGAEIALEAAKEHPVLLSGRDTGHVPFNIEGRMAKLFLTSFVLRFLFHRVLTTNTFIGRKARPKTISMGGPLVRIKPKQFSVAGIKRVSRITGVKDGKPVVDNTTGFGCKEYSLVHGLLSSFSWIDIPVFKDQEPEHDRGVVLNEPGLYFLGIKFPLCIFICHDSWCRKRC
jgi:putative flavoprotein involved in K+ transport